MERSSSLCIVLGQWPAASDGQAYGHAKPSVGLFLALPNAEQGEALWNADRGNQELFALPRRDWQCPRADVGIAGDIAVTSDPGAKRWLSFVSDEVRWVRIS